MVNCELFSVYFATPPVPRNCAIAHILIRSVTLAFVPKSGFRNKSRAEFRLQKWGPFTTLFGHHTFSSKTLIADKLSLPWITDNVSLKFFCRWTSKVNASCTSIFSSCAM